MLLAAAVQYRLEADSLPRVQDPDALGSAELVSGEREQIDTEGRDVDRFRDERLDRIGMHERRLVDGFDRLHNVADRL